MEEGRRGQKTRSSPHVSLCAWMYGLWIYFPPPNLMLTLEVRRDAVENLKAMGVTAIRQGGSFADARFYYWKYWRGRPSYLNEPTDVCEH